MSNGAVNRALRGQASIELALGLVVFITVVAFGIHFAEVSYLATRVATATHAALLRATGERAHVKGSDSRLYGTVAGRVTSEHKKYWNDFNPTMGEGAAPVSHVMTKIEKSNDNLVRCTNVEELRSELVLGMTTPYDRRQRGGIGCAGEAEISVLPVFPKQFLDNNWGLKTANYSGPTNFRVCATPRSRRGGRCGQIPILVGDYSLQGARGSESRSHDLFRGGNKDFEDLVSGAFGGSPFCLASAGMMASLTLVNGSDTCFSVLSFKSHEAGFRQSMSGHNTRGPWGTAGYEGVLRDRNNKAYFLGVKR